MKHPLELIFRSTSKLMIKCGISLQEAVELLKVALVQAAAEEEDATDSVISLRTGVHRKDVKRLRSGEQKDAHKKIPISPISLVMTHWTQEHPFCEALNKPRILPQKGSAGQPGFDDLVKSCRIDLTAATVLGELKKNGLVKIMPGQEVALLSTTFIPQASKAALQAFDATVADHISVAAENTLQPPGQPRQLDQVVRYSHLSPESVAILRAKAEAQARQYLEELNSLAHRLQMEDGKTVQDVSGRFVSGVFVATKPFIRANDKQKDVKT